MAALADGITDTPSNSAGGAGNLFAPDDMTDDLEICGLQKVQ